MEMKNVVVVDAARAPQGRGGRGLLVHRDMAEVAAQVLKTLLDRNPKVELGMIEDFGVGNVSGGFFTGGKVIGLLAGLPHEICTYEVNRQCGSSMEAMQQLARAIMVGDIRTAIVSGIERMGTGLGGADMMPKGEGPKPDFGKIMKQNDVMKAPAKNHDELYSVAFPDYVVNTMPMQAMTQTAQNTAEIYGITRQAQDEFACNSHMKAAKATDAGKFNDEIVPIETWRPVIGDDRKVIWKEKGEKITMKADECIRPETTIEKLSGLRAIKGIMSFAKPAEDIMITPGNSCPTNDGASALILMEEELARDLGLKPLARIRGMAVGGVKPQLMGLGPIPASKKALGLAKVEAKDISVCEFNEAFASQSIACIKDIGLNPDAVNVNGGAIAIGHPLGATGARLICSLSHELKRMDGDNLGLATQCIGTGQGIATVLEKC